MPAVLLTLCGLNVTATAANAAKAIEGVTFDQTGSHWHLQADGAAWDEVLAAIRKGSGTEVHFAAAPACAITAACTGPTLKHILACIVGEDADIMLRYSPGKNDRAPLEAWVISNVDAATKRLSPCQPIAHKAASTPVAVNIQAEPTFGSMDGLIDIAHSSDVNMRTHAVAFLANQVAAEESVVHAELQAALRDSDPGVRAQAVAGLAKRAGTNAHHILAAALKDPDATVRLMVVDLADASDSRDAGLLSTAGRDADDIVRNSARTKLAKRFSSNS